MVGYQSQFCCFQSISFIEAIEGVYIVVPMDNSEKIGKNKRENEREDTGDDKDENKSENTSENVS